MANPVTLNARQVLGIIKGLAVGDSDTISMINLVTADYETPDPSSKDIKRLVDPEKWAFLAGLGENHRS